MINGHQKQIMESPLSTYDGIIRNIELSRLPGFIQLRDKVSPSIPPPPSFCSSYSVTLKSTRHLYIPASLSWMSSTRSSAGLELSWK